VRAGTPCFRLRLEAQSGQVGLALSCVPRGVRAGALLEQSRGLQETRDRTKAPQRAARLLQLGTSPRGDRQVRGGLRQLPPSEDREAARVDPSRPFRPFQRVDARLSELDPLGTLGACPGARDCLGGGGGSSPALASSSYRGR